MAKAEAFLFAARSSVKAELDNFESDLKAPEQEDPLTVFVFDTLPTFLAVLLEVFASFIDLVTVFVFLTKSNHHLFMKICLNNFTILNSIFI